MRLTIIAISFFAAALAVSSCYTDKIRPEGPVNERTEEFSTEAREIEISSGIKAVFDSRLEDGTVIIRTNSDIQKYIFCREAAGRLEIYIDTDGKGYNNLNVTAYVPAGQFTGLCGRGGASFEGQPTTPDMEISLDGGSKLSCSGLALRSATVLAEGGSHAVLRGDCQETVLTCTGGSHADLSGMHSVEAEVEVSGGSDVSIFVRDAIRGRCDISSHIEISGNPEINEIRYN